MKENCAYCGYVRKTLDIAFIDEEGFYCSRYHKRLNYRYTDEEFPLIEPCEECKGGDRYDAG